MQINVPNILKKESGTISSILVKLYEPLIVADNPNAKFAKPLKSIQIPVNFLDKDGNFSYAEVHDSVYANFKSLAFIVSYKNGSVDTIPFQDKALFEKQCVEESLVSAPISQVPTVEPTAQPVAEPAATPAPLPSAAPEVAIPDFEDSLTQEEKMLEARLNLLRSAEVVAKRREFMEISKRLAQLNTELQPVWLGKMQKTAN
jgi:hypothetical protein